MTNLNCKNRLSKLSKLKELKRTKRININHKPILSKCCKDILFNRKNLNKIMKSNWTIRMEILLIKMDNYNNNKTINNNNNHLKSNSNIWPLHSLIPYCNSHKPHNSELISSVKSHESQQSLKSMKSSSSKIIPTYQKAKHSILLNTWQEIFNI